MLGVRGAVSGGVPDGCDDQFHVPVVQAGDGVAQADGDAVGDAGGEPEEALLAAFSELETVISIRWSPAVSRMRAGSR